MNSSGSKNRDAYFAFKSLEAAQLSLKISHRPWGLPKLSEALPQTNMCENPHKRKIKSAKSYMLKAYD